MQTVQGDVRSISVEDFAALGVGRIGYIRPALNGGVPCYAVMSGAGEPIATAADLKGAQAALLHFNLKPVALH